jgi:mannitol/fructose-specific phosphotransferase system IIA component
LIGFSDKVEMPYILCAKTGYTDGVFPPLIKKMIDIVLVLVSPDKYGPLHLQYLSRLTRMFREEKLLTAIRSVTSVDGMVAVLSSDKTQPIAA